MCQNCSKELAKTYDPKSIEERLYKKWEDNGYFHAEADRSKKPFTIVMPPPNITGQLHMGHALDNTMQDILTRYKRMQGYNALWQPGTDHASIATEVKVIENLKAQGIDKRDLGREGFLEKCWDWKEEYGSRIINQLKKMGSSADWERERFTMDKGCSDAVLDVFVKLYEKGMIYKGSRIVNWCPVCKTSISDAEVEHEEQDGFFWHINYPVVGEEGRFVEIATTRPETLFGDTAVAVNPEDERYKDIVGKTLKLPMTDREIPVIADAYVDKEFGTGCVKITPAHDPNDFEVGKRHNLGEITVINDDATMNAYAGKYEGMDRYECRKALVADLEEQGLLVKVEPHSHNVGTHDRCGTTVEPMVKQQWFVKMDELIKPAVEAVKNGEIKLLPKRMEKTYFNWTDNIRDWCISRQLWWGHRIPAYYYVDPAAPGKESFVVAESLEKALEKVHAIKGCEDVCASDLVQDPGALDTWFSSWLWPITLFDGINNPGNEEISYYYPTATLVTGPDIIFFWVARMIMAGYEYVGKEPFRNVYFTGIVRDSLGRKMSKSLGNSPDPLKLMADFGADGVRLGLMLSAPAGNDILFDEKLCETGRNFSNKLWNVFRLISQWAPESASADTPAEDYSDADKAAVSWFASKLSMAVAEVNDLMEKFRISEAANLLYRLIRDDFSSSFLEMVKPAYGKRINGEVYAATVKFFDDLLRMLHPFMPFITEEIWQNLQERRPGESLMVQMLPESVEVNHELLKEMDFAMQVVTAVRGVRASKNLPQRDELVLLSISRSAGLSAGTEALVRKLANLSGIENNAAKPQGPTASFIVDTTEFAIPLAANIDVEAERAKIEKEIAYHSDFLRKIEAKLANERFVSKAPAPVIEAERRKQADTQARLDALRASLASLS